MMNQRGSEIELNAGSEFNIKHLCNAGGQQRYVLGVPIDAFDDSHLYDLGREFIAAVNEYAKENSTEGVVSKKNTKDAKAYIITTSYPEDFTIVTVTLDEDAAKHYCDVHNLDPDNVDFVYEEYDLNEIDYDEEQRTLYTCAILLVTGEVIGEEEEIVIVNKNVDLQEREIRIEAGPFGVMRDYGPSDLAIFAKSFISAKKAYDIACDYRDLVNGNIAGKIVR